MAHSLLLLLPGGRREVRRKEEKRYLGGTQGEKLDSFVEDEVFLSRQQMATLNVQNFSSHIYLRSMPKECLVFMPF